MNTKVIYQPSGKALEYSELACNLYSGCSHACKYCYCPSILRKTLDEWSENPQPRKNILKNLESDCQKLTDTEKQKELLFCFMCDPYQSVLSAEITRKALLICEKYQIKNIQVLTKGGELAINDFDILSRNKWKFGSTIIFTNEKDRQEWEPGAASIESRYNAVKKAHEMKIFTWISIEPVIYTQQSLQVIRDLLPFVNFWKIGKLNHFPKIESKIDWKKFLEDCIKILRRQNYYIKKDLAKYL